MSEQLSRAAKALIEAARGGDEPTVADMERVRAGVDKAVAAGGAGAGISVVIKVLAVVAIVGGVGFGVWMMSGSGAESAETTVASLSTPPPPTTTTTTTTTTSTSTVVEPVVESGSVPVKAKAMAMDPLESLREEKALIERATERLDGGDPGGALKILGEHAKRFRKGQLTAERVGTRVLALCALGKADLARKEAGRFMGRFGGHPMAGRVAEACAE